MLNSNPIVKYFYKHHSINIYYDEGLENNPRLDGNNLGVMLYAPNNKYRKLGDEEWSQDRIADLEKNDSCVCVSVYFAVTVNGIVLSTNPIGGFYESGKCGIIYNTKQNLDKLKSYFYKDKKDLLGSFYEYGWAGSIFEREIRIFSDFLEGKVYGYQTENSSNKVLDSCWGYIGVDLKEIYQEAKEIIDKCYATEEKTIEQLTE